MKISYNWLKDLVDFNMPPQDLCKMLTFLGVETTIVSGGTNWTGVVTAKVLDKQKHSNSDHLSVCKVSDGTKEYQVVCGAPNVAAGQTVPLALIGAVLPGNFVIKASKIRGVASEGMICSQEELGLVAHSDGIMVLDEETPLGKKLEDVLTNLDTVLEIEITTNRGDCLSHLGVAREIAAKLQKNPIIPEIKTSKIAEKTILDIKAKDLCTRYIGCHITGVKVAPSPKWITDKLEVCGIKSINNIVDITNYVMLELGHPLHAFDASTLGGDKVVVRRAENGEKIAALDGKTHELSEKDLIIADASKPIAIAGVIGGEFSSIKDTTTEVFLEAAVFNPGSVRKTARRLNISTDASYRYERGTSWEIAELAGWRALNLILELAGGRAEFREDYNIPENKRAIIKLRFEKVSKLLGYKVDEETIANILRFLGIEIDSKVQDVLIATVPSYRNDIKEDVDLIEEVARINGYDKIPVVTDFKSASSDKNSLEKPCSLTEDLINSLTGLGFSEAMNYSFAEIKDLNKLYLNYTYKIANPISKENEVLRPSLLPGLMKNFDFNIGQATNDIKLFELGKIFDDKGERRVLGILMSGPVWQSWWKWESAKLNPVFDFYFASGIISNILPSKEFSISENRNPAKYFHPGKTAAIVYHGKPVGQFGVLRPDVVDAASEVVYAEIEVENIEKVYRNKVDSYEHIAKFPSVKRDISVVADKSVKFEKIEKVIKNIMRDGGILKDWSLFSVYESDKLGEGKISYSFRLSYRHNDKTLNDSEVNTDMSKLLEKLNKELGITLRN